MFGVPYGNSYNPLYSGYESWFPGYGTPPYPPGMGPQWADGRMRVYGDSNIVISQPLPSSWLTVQAVDQYYNPLDANIYVDGNWIGTGSGSVYLPNGGHSISGDACVWDDYLQTYVWSSGNGGIYLTHNTYAYICYGFDN